MKFAKIVFRIAGIRGFAGHHPLYFMFNLIGQKRPSPNYAPRVLLRFRGRRDGLADGVSLHRCKSGALSPSHDSICL